MDKNLIFQDSGDLADLAKYLERAYRLDKAGASKLRAFGKVLAIYVSPIYSGSMLGDGLTVIGLRTINLAREAELDLLFTIEDLLAKVNQAIAAEVLEVSLPANTTRVSWAGISPPRQGWQLTGEIDQQTISQWAKDGIAEVAQSLPESIGSAIAARVRLQIWGKAVGIEHNLPAGAAFAMAGLGFMQKGVPVKVYRAHGWIRLTTDFGHVISKESFKFS
ncbi:MAG: hypothetical protein HOK86_02560 [Micrococcales bacterium]|jgi:hypothetical protein|nr:hypothetical protein [Micrococcales bacterium]MDG1817763.1 hypothetical protein [Aquiluna sp.]MBT5398483.1 hypothetical protein [Micrococcales bacterium]MBT5431245.1 hypothetical protein [Micrococcales bacterium]MBT5848768.1 hypothetical protein [Micrococcales bacterium]